MKWHEKLSGNERIEVLRLSGLLNLPALDEYLDLSAFLETVYNRISEAKGLMRQAGKVLNI